MNDIFLFNAASRRIDPDYDVADISRVMSLGTGLPPVVTTRTMNIHHPDNIFEFFDVTRGNTNLFLCN